MNLKKLEFVSTQWWSSRDCNIFQQNKKEKVRRNSKHTKISKKLKDNKKKRKIKN